MTTCPCCRGTGFSESTDFFEDFCFEPCDVCGGDGEVSQGQARLWLSRRAARVIRRPDLKAGEGSEQRWCSSSPRPSRRGLWSLIAAVLGGSR